MTVNNAKAQQNGTAGTHPTAPQVTVQKPRRLSHDTALTPFIFMPQRTRTERARRRTDMSI
ncbi:MAG: hypothetical protein K2H16_05945, partial [Prevotella sp.]|nr:hypothetical protein [Prevotella sp.]